MQSYVTEDKVYCVYITPDEATVRKHAELGGFPAVPNSDGLLYELGWLIVGSMGIVRGGASVAATRQGWQHT
jgi:hypothetical protein